MAYTYDNQYYAEYVERLSAGSKTATFNRAGNLLPGVPPNELTARLGYDQPVGPWKGVGAFIEVQWKDSFYMDNANLLKAPGYEVVNFNLHYDKEVADSYIKDAIFFFEIKNLFDQTYVASANNISDTINSTTGLQESRQRSCRHRDRLDLRWNATRFHWRNEIGIPMRGRSRREVQEQLR